MDPLKLSMGCEYELDQHEPTWSSEENGLLIEAYEIDDQMILNFDWQPGSQWDKLEDPAVFQEMAQGLVERMTGSMVEVVPIEALAEEHALAAQEETPAGAGCSLTGAEGGSGPDAEACGCPL